MTNNDFVEFTQVWLQAAELYGQSPSDNVIQLVFSALVRYEIADIRSAITRHINDPKAGSFMPKPADIVRQLDGMGDQRAWMAWSKVDKAIRSVGSYQSVVFDDHIIMRVVQDMGGWDYLCMQPDETALSIKSHEFKTRYERYTQAPPQTFPARLIGHEEASRLALDLPVQPPVMVGDQQQCMKVLSLGSSQDTTITRLTTKTFAEHLEALPHLAQGALQ